jgi:hypothetical protein
MFKHLIILIGIFLFFNHSRIAGQTSVILSKPRIEVKDSILIISFDILNSREDEKFNIWVEATDSLGNNLAAKSLRGDIGGNINGGYNKSIIWNFWTDSTYLDYGIYIQVYAEISKTANVSKPIHPTSRAGAISRSLLFPGWGLSRINPGKPHWIKGIAGYGCITAAIVYNKKAVSSYSDYLTSFDTKESESYFNNSVNQDKLSRVFAYSAIGIWLTDFIWTVAGSSVLKNNSKPDKTSGFTVKPFYDSKWDLPFVSIRYDF